MFADKESPQCVRCANCKPSIYGWRCHAVPTSKSEPDPIDDILEEGTYCAAFMFRTSFFRNGKVSDEAYALCLE